MRHHRKQRRRLAATRVGWLLATCAIVLCGITVPARPAHAATATSLPASFVTYPLNDPNAGANTFSLGPDGRWWMAGFDGSTIERVTTAGVDSPLQLGSTVFDPQIIAGSDGNAWMSHLNPNFNASVIDKISPSGTLLATYPLSTFAFGMVLGPDGNIWFSIPQGSEQSIARITPAGVVSTVVQTPGRFVNQLVDGPDGNVWATSGDATGSNGEVVRVTPDGVLTAFPLPAFDGQSALPGSLTAGPDGNFWYVDGRAGAIGRVTPAGVVTQFVVPDGVGVTFQRGLATGPDGNLWFTARISGGPAVGRITASGQIGLFGLSTAGQPLGPIAAGPDGRIWLPLANPARLAAFPPSAPPPSPPDIRSVSTRYSLPSGGGQVTVTGLNVGLATQVLFGSTPATSFQGSMRARWLRPSRPIRSVPSMSPWAHRRAHQSPRRRHFSILGRTSTTRRPTVARRSARTRRWQRTSAPATPAARRSPPIMSPLT
jgi:streptogramin lyase